MTHPGDKISNSKAPPIDTDNNEMLVEKDILIEDYRIIQIKNHLDKILGQSFQKQSKLDRNIKAYAFSQLNPDTQKIDRIGNTIILSGEKKTVSIDVRYFFDGGGKEAIQEISLDEVKKLQQKKIATYKEKVVLIGTLKDAIHNTLDINSNEVFGVIEADDTINEGVFRGRSIIEAALIFRKKIGESQDALKDIGSVDRTMFPDADKYTQELIEAQEEYLMLVLGIGDKREGLTHVIPKTKEEITMLISSSLSRRNPAEALEWMRDIHTQIDANNWQSGTVEKNYKFFTDELNALVLGKIKYEVMSNPASQYYHDISLFLEFAVITSGRVSWNRESFPLLHDWGENASPVDQRLWDPEIANTALMYAMQVPSKTQGGLSHSMMDTMKPHLDVHDAISEGKNPNSIVFQVKEILSQNIYEPNSKGALVPIGITNTEKILGESGYQGILTSVNADRLADNYSDLSIIEMIQIGSLVRLLKGLKQKQASPKLNEKLRVKDFGILAQESQNEASQHISDEINNNFDDGLVEIVTDSNRFTAKTVEERNIWRAQKFGIRDKKSLEYQIFSLYNSINGNGEFGEISDTTKELVGTGLFMGAMVLGSMAFGGGAILGLARLGYSVTSLAAEGAILGSSGSAVGYIADFTLGDARGFYTPGEAVVGISSDFALGALTGAIGGPLVERLGSPQTKFISQRAWKNKKWWKNRAIFAGDLAALGLGPEYARIEAVNEAWNGSDIFTPSVDGNPVLGKILNLQKKKLIFKGSPKEVETYLQIVYSDGYPNSLSKDVQAIYDGLPIGLKEYSETKSIIELSNYRFRKLIDKKLDARFSRACSIYKMLHPNNPLQLPNEPEFKEVLSPQSGFRKDKHWYEKKRKDTVEATIRWIERQEKILKEVS